MLLAAAAAAIFVALVVTFGSRPQRPFNLILISIDTLRPDRLGMYGYGRVTSPALDAFAAERGVVFDNAVSVSSWTLPAHVSMLSGVLPTSHGVTRPNVGKIGEGTELLAEMLRRRGYSTLAFTGGAYVGRRWGFSRGFDVFGPTERRAGRPTLGFAASIARARDALDEIPKDRPYFLFLHTYDAHCPHEPPAAYGSLFRSESAEWVDATRCQTTSREAAALTPGQVQFLSDRYDASIRWVDDQIHVLLRLLDSRGDLDHSVVIVTADHGEEFREHGQLGHRTSLYRELLMVPLIVAVPGNPPGRVRSPVSLVDLVPTVLELLQLPPSPQVQGVSLVPLLIRGDEGSSGRTVQLAELDLGVELKSLMDGSLHLIADQKTGMRRLFDMQSDPTEQRDLVATRTEIVETLERRLQTMLAGFPPPEALSAPDPLTPAQTKRLKALGYL